MVSRPMGEAFVRDCGLGAALGFEVGQAGRPGTERRVVETPFALVGRDEGNQLCLPDSQVSRRHAFFQVIAGGVFCVDLGSRTGARWNGEARPAGWVAPADRLEVGPFTLRLAAAGPEPGPPDGPDLFDPLAADTAPPSAPWALELPGGIRWCVNRALTLVGKASRCKLRPNTPEASRYHCALVRAATGVWVVDLLSSRGTYVNGESVLYALLREGDELRIGRVALRLRGEAAAGGGGVSLTLGDGDGAAYLSPAGPAPPDEAAAGEEAPPLPDRGLLPRVPAEPRPPALPASSPPELQEALLGPVLSQFSMMQQQLLEQFHQTMVMMAQVFGNLHRDQMALIREELTQLHQVTQELQTLHVELARRPPTEAAVEDGLPQSAGARTAGGEHAVAAPPRPPPSRPAGGPPPAGQAPAPGGGGSGQHPHLTTPALGGPRSGAQEPLGQNPPLHDGAMTRRPPSRLARQVSTRVAMITEL